MPISAQELIDWINTLPLPEKQKESRIALKNLNRIFNVHYFSLDKDNVLCLNKPT